MSESANPHRRALRSDAQRNHRRILAAARAELAEQGPAIRLEDVARRAEVGLATLYRRFASRRELVAAVFDQYFTEEVEPLLAEAAAEPDAWHGLRRGLEESLETVVRNEALLHAVRESGVTMSDVLPRFLAPMGEVLRRAQQDGQVRAELEERDLTAVLVMVLATATTGLAERATGAADGWRRYLALLLDGSRAGGAELPCPPDESSVASEC